jgi:ATP-dependent Clp protease, protease subunit
MNPTSTLVPVVIENTHQGERSYDLYSRLLKDRIVMFNGEFNEASCNVAIAQLLFLEAENPEKEILLYINSPGGSVYDGMGLIDTVRFIKPEVHTIVTGYAMSMGSLLLGAGQKGKRYALPNSRIMVHQPSGGAKGMASDIEINYKEIQYLKEKLTHMLSDFTNGKTSYEEMAKLCDRDTYLSPEQAIEIGLIDEIIQSRKIGV